jgi:pilus assembly protein CpaF
MSNFDLIIPHLAPIEHLIMDQSISEIMINPPGGQVFIERGGDLLGTNIMIDEHKLQAAIRSIARVLGQDVSEQHPLLDSRLPDGSRVAATMPPVSVSGASLTIRKFPARRFTAEELVRLEMLTQQQLDVLRHAVEKRETVLISGGTGTGKSTLLNALAEFIPADDRIILIEDVSEISLTQKNVVRLEARRELPGVPEVSIRMLLRMALRMRPSRVLLGEVRGPEAADLLQALNTGHEGSISTIHSNSARTAGTRLRDCVLMSGPGMSAASVSASIASAIQILIQIERRAGKRYVKEMVRVKAYKPEIDAYDLKDIS